MRTIRPAKDRFKPNLKYARDGRSTKKFPWTKTAIGCGLKILIGLIGDEIAPEDIDFSRQFPKDQVLFQRLLLITPWVMTYYQAQWPLDAKVVYDRYHKMYYWNTAPTRRLRGQRSQEHYKVHPKLRFWVEQVEPLLLKGKEITVDELTEAMKGWPNEPSVL